MKCRYPKTKKYKQNNYLAPTLKIKHIPILNELQTLPAELKFELETIDE